MTNFCDEILWRIFVTNFVTHYFRFLSIPLQQWHENATALYQKLNGTYDTSVKIMSVVEFLNDYRKHNNQVYQFVLDSISDIDESFKSGQVSFEGKNVENFT